MLKKSFSCLGWDKLALIIVLTGLIWTNLYFYTMIAPATSHTYSFCLFADFIFVVDSWVMKPSWGNSAFIGLIGGLIILVRPSNGIIFILFPLWQVDSVAALKGDR